MGSHGRSIRRRIYYLVTIPLIALIGLFAYVATTSIHNAINLDRAPNLINATSLPTANFVNLLQAERLAAVTYAFDPTSPSAAAAFSAATQQTRKGEQTFLRAMNSTATTGTETAAEGKGIAAMEAQLSQLPLLEGAISQTRVTAIQAFGAYSKAIVNEPTLFLTEADSMTNATAADQAVGLIAAVSAREQLSEEDALLSGMLVAPKSTTAQQRSVFAQARAAFNIAAANRQAETLDANSILSPANLAVYDAPQAGTASLQQQLALIEEAVATGTPIDKLGITPQQWAGLTTTLLSAEFTGGKNDAAAQLVVDGQITHAAWTRVGYVSGIVLAGLLLTFLITTLVGRGIIRRLRDLEQSAITLAEQQLPEVITRLRRGDDVDVATEAPPLRVGADEIGRVGQAFDLVRKTAISSAVEEAKLRRGLNDVFRSLARRSQSLLHRQLTLLDQMERRATDPEALDDLFRLDHLTTRMRRHAEGLVILAGAPPGRAWSSPVRMVDVMRGAIAEVEDYARVSVATRSQAALSGSAVADVIHLLAELIENATTLSPPYTSVRVSGDIVGNGFAIEVEDRGLGISAQRISELNDRLANPPEFNPSDSEQLGLFVVGQLARRHGIKVTLKSSPYGGTEAVVLIPRQLVVTEEAYRVSLPGEQAAAITVGASATTNGNGFPSLTDLGDVGDVGAPGVAPAGLGAPNGSKIFDDGPPVLDGGPAGSRPYDGPVISAGPRIAGPLRRSQGSFPEGAPRGGHHATPRSGGSGVTSGSGGLGGSGGFGGSGGLSGGGLTNGNGNGFASGPDRDGLGGGDLPRRIRTGTDHGGPDHAGPDRAEAASAAAGQPGADAATEFDVFNPGHRNGGEQPDPAQPFQEVQGSAASPRTTGPQSTLPYATGLPDRPPAFPAWPGQGGSASPAGAPAHTFPATPFASATPATSAPGATASRPPWELSDDTETRPVVPAEVEPEPPDGAGQADGEFKGLPRRVKQASIAPQLRDLAKRRSTAADAATVPGPTPEEIRATMSALQRGMKEGRSQRPGGGEPPWERDPEGDSNAT
jgi:signal transduction histidine kinase